MAVKKYTTTSYIEHCKLIHNDKYDYTLVEYSRLKDNIIIICKKHGKFNQRAQSHLIGATCVKCYKESRNITSEQFIEKSKKIHNNKFNYTFTYFKSLKNIIDIECKKHGIFKQLALNHLKGQGCKKCAQDTNRISTQEFINKSNIIHKNNYDYSLVNYINHSTKVDIICKEHGIFKQTPNNHICNKQGCNKCNGGVKYTLLDFIKLSNLKHNKRYNYSLVDYVDNLTKVDIICKEHGVFKQLPGAHMRGQNCLKCKIDNRKILLDEFIRKSNLKHNNKYNYSNINFTGLSSYVSILCDCGLVFSQKAKNHLHGNGCPKCNSKNISKSETKWLDMLKIPKEFRHKTIKINNKNYFLDAVDIKNKIIYEFYGDYWHGNPNIYNNDDINKNNKKLFRELYQNTIDRENTLRKNGYDIISIWESEFKNNNKYEY